MEKIVLVTGIGGNVGQGIARNIKSLFSDIKIIGIDISFFTSGSYLCDKTYQSPYAYSPNYISFIQEIVTKEKIDLILPSTDYEVYYLSKNKNLIKAEIFVNSSDITNIYLDKYQSYLHHKTHGIPFAPSWLPQEYQDIKKDIIAKPREGRGSRGIIINPPDPKELPEDYMIQPLFNGKEITTAVYVTKDYSLHGIFTMERELTNGTTSKSKVVFDYDKKLNDIVKMMITAGKLTGCFNLQSIVTQEGEIIPFEVNCRISGTNSIRHNLGFQDVKYALQEYLYNQQPDKPSPIKGIATRILLDVIYPFADNEQDITNKNANHMIY